MVSLIARGFLFGRSELVNFEYDPAKPYTYCRICGRLRQTAQDRSINDERSALEALKHRREWSVKHSKLHTEKAHLELALSGLHLTPEAAHKLAPYGIIDLIGLVLYEGSTDAYASAPRAPTDDADSS